MMWWKYHRVKIKLREQCWFQNNNNIFISAHTFFHLALSFSAECLSSKYGVFFQVFSYPLIIAAKRKLLVTMSPDWDWKNFGKEKKNFPHPHRRGDRPPETVNPRPLIDLKRGCILRLTLIQHCHLKQITFALPVSNTWFTLPLHHVWDAETPPSPGHFSLVLMALSPHGTSKSSR